jgi:hypothetical protein
MGGSDGRGRGGASRGEAPGRWGHRGYDGGKRVDLGRASGDLGRVWGWVEGEGAEDGGAMC